MALPGRNVRYRTYSTRHDRTAPRYDITITVDRDGGHLPDPAEFTVTAQQAASARGAAIVSEDTAR